MTEKTKVRGLGRREFLATGAAALGVGLTGFPAVLRAQPAAVKLGLIHPVTGFVAFSGTQCREGALMAIADINAAGGIKSLGGAKLEAVLGDSQGKPDLGAAEVTKMVEAGVDGIVAGYSSAISLATSQEAAKSNTPHIVDVGVSDQIVQRGLANTFRFAPGYGSIAKFAVDNLGGLNQLTDSPAKTAMIIHEESLFGTGTAELLAKELPGKGIEVIDVIKHANPTRDFTNIVLQIKSKKPDLIIPANYYNEYVLFARTLRQQRVEAKGIYSVLGGAASNYQFVKEFPEAAEFIMDCNHWFNPKSEVALARKAAAEAKGLFYTYEVFLTYNAVLAYADAVERAGSTDKAAVNEALANSTLDMSFMPYGPTQMINGQNMGAKAVNTQVLKGEIEVIFPQEFASAMPVFPMNG
ncbi:ABC transporter substrate-binding protein [Polymorphum gilvum]|uniref:ABC transporter, substrate-binding protein n=1 Tax=Polymorphum gilvum (strain LMG 25793 / CGMCC 1.9160 / SL003B-26A1) TaxID=991905 RepID=F2J4K6_POLGS|nr:ABC transporter substrate-binding protein [Polymorphum gilvum]ADZ72258.1 ABC transporter, substrate-binding protein [Polymorphum gilvum SL003B-26A1]